MNNNEPTDIIETLQDIRRTDYPEIPEEIVAKIVKAEYETIGERGQSRKYVSDIVEEYLEGE